MGVIVCRPRPKKAVRIHAPVPLRPDTTSVVDTLGTITGAKGQLRNPPREQTGKPSNAGETVPSVGGIYSAPVAASVLGPSRGSNVTVPIDPRRAMTLKQRAAYQLLVNEAIITPDEKIAAEQQASSDQRKVKRNNRVDGRFCTIVTFVCCMLALQFIIPINPFVLLMRKPCRVAKPPGAKRK